MSLYLNKCDDILFLQCGGNEHTKIEKLDYYNIDKNLNSRWNYLSGNLIFHTHALSQFVANFFFQKISQEYQFSLNAASLLSFLHLFTHISFSLNA